MALEEKDLTKNDEVNPEGEVFDFDNLNPGTWFDYGEKGARVCIRVCPMEEIQKVQRLTSTKKIIYKNNIRHEFLSQTDAQKTLESEMMWEYCLPDWEGILDKNKKPIPCEKEFKILLMNKSIDFATFVSKKLQVLAKLQEEEEEEAVKN